MSTPHTSSFSLAPPSVRQWAWPRSGCLQHPQGSLSRPSACSTRNINRHAFYVKLSDHLHPQSSPFCSSACNYGDTEVTPFLNVLSQPRSGCHQHITILQQASLTIYNKLLLTTSVYYNLQQASIYNKLLLQFTTSLFRLSAASLVFLRWLLEADRADHSMHCMAFETTVPSATSSTVKATHTTVRQALINNCQLPIFLDCYSRPACFPWPP